MGKPNEAAVLWYVIDASNILEVLRMQKIKHIIVRSLMLCFLTVFLCGCAAADSGEQSLPDANLNDAPTQSISVDGDFNLNVKFYAVSSTGEPNPVHEIRTELLWEDERLVICFGGLKTGNSSINSAVLYRADGSQEVVECTIEDTNAKQNVSEKNISIELCRTGETMTLKAKKAGLFRSTTILDMMIPLKEIAAQEGAVRFSGENLILTDIRWNRETPVTPDIDPNMPVKNIIINLIVTLVISVIMFILVGSVLDWIREIRGYRFSLSRATVSSACLLYGGMMILSWENLAATNSILRFINRIYSGVESHLTLPAEGTIFADRRFVFAIIIVGIIFLLWGVITEKKVEVIPVIIIYGLLILATVYPWIQLIWEITSGIIKGLEGMGSVIILFLFLVMAGSGSSATSSSTSPRTERKHEETEADSAPDVKVWKEDDYGYKEYLKVSSDGQRYFDPKDSEWHKIK